MLYEKIQEAISYIRLTTDFQPTVGIILGTGLGSLTDRINVTSKIRYNDIPNFPTSTVESHSGELIFGELAGKKIVAMSGRVHYYEGYSMKEVTFPVRVLKFLGIKTIIISNAAGSTNANIKEGEIVFVRDHINLQPENPLRGYNDERIGPRFPDMKDAYSPKLIQLAEKVATEKGINFHKGVYLGLQGPNLETPAEYNYIHTIGADLVGMSTIPEVIVSKHMDLKIFVISVVSNQCFPIENITQTTIEEVIEVVGKASPKMIEIVEGMLEQMPATKV